MPVTADQLYASARAAVGGLSRRRRSLLSHQHGLEDADLVQEAVMAAWRAMHTTYDGAVSRPQTYMTLKASYHLLHVARAGGLVRIPRGARFVPTRQFAEFVGEFGTEFAAAHLLADRPTVTTPDEVWAEYRPLRRGWPPLTRLWAYLVVVEGMTYREVAGLWGCDKGRVSERLLAVGVRRHKPGLTTNAA
jgi:DNA-directed RNA polymerase specialized sigma24 family protein